MTHIINSTDNYPLGYLVTNKPTYTKSTVMSKSLSLVSFPWFVVSVGRLKMDHKDHMDHPILHLAKSHCVT